MFVKNNNEEKSYVNIDVFDLAIFDKNEKLITQINTARKSNIFTVENKIDSISKTYLEIKSDILKNKILELFAKKENNIVEKTDYLSYLNKYKEHEVDTYVFNNTKNKEEYKLIAKGCMYNLDTETIGQNYLFEIPKAALSNKFTFQAEGKKATEQNLVFELLPYNNNGDIFKVHIIK